MQSVYLYYPQLSENKCSISLYLSTSQSIYLSIYLPRLLPTSHSLVRQRRPRRRQARRTPTPRKRPPWRIRYINSCCNCRRLSFVFLSFRHSFFMSFFLSFYLYVILSFCLCVFLSFLHSSLFLSFCLYVRLSFFISVFVYFCLSVILSICLCFFVFLFLLLLFLLLL